MLESQSAGEISSRSNQNKNSRYYENTLAHMLGREEDQGFFKDHRGHLVQPVLTPTPEGSPFGVELELVEDVISSSHFVHSSSAPCKHSLERLEVDKYHVYYVLAGKGKLGHLNGKGEVLDDTVVTLNSGDIFVLAPSVPYIIETNDEKEEEEGGEGEKELTPMAMLSISVPSSLLGHQSHSRPSAAHASSERERMPEQIRLNHQETEGCLLSSRLRRTTELLTFQLPNGNKNRIAPVFDPFRDCTPFTCSIEILEPKGVIPRHKHDKAYELFIILSGCADLYLNDITKISGQHGDTLLVKPQNFHSLVNPDENEKLYMLSIILPNETFAEDVWNGKFSGKLQNADVDHLVDNVSSSSSSSSSSASGSGSGGRRVLTKN